MGKWIKKVATLLVVGFVLFFIILYPSESAGTLKTFGAALQDAFWRVYDFFASLG